MNIFYLLLLMIIVFVINNKNNILLDFRTACSTKSTYIIAHVFYWAIVVTGIALNFKKVRNLIIVIIISFINYFLLEKAITAFMPW